jgi:hypothetical protein
MNELIVSLIVKNSHLHTCYNYLLNLSAMKYLLIDTDVYIQCAVLEYEGDDIKAIETLLEMLNKGKVKLLLPEVVKIEFYRVLVFD